MKRSDRISDYILAALSAGGGIAEMQRGAIAREFGCVPSQITYVLETRFTPENGYLIETRRGGGGYIRIIRKRDDPQQQLADLCSVTHQAVSKWENGGCFPDITVIPILADFFGVTTDYLLRGTPRKVQYLAANYFSDKWRMQVNEKYLQKGWRVEDIEVSGDGDGAVVMALVLEKEIFE